MSTVDTTNKYNFAYSVGVVRTLESLLLNENETDRMMLASSADEAFRILNELDYANNKAGVTESSDFQRVIDEGLLETKKYLDKVTPDKNTLNIIWLNYDFHNIKTMLKAKLSEKPYEEIESMISDLGAIPVESLKKYIFEDEETPFNLKEVTEKYIKKIIKEAEQTFHKEKENPQVIDLYLDQKLMKTVFGITTDSKNQFLIDYIRILIDLNNIRLFFRMKAQDKELDLFEYGFLWNGNLDYNRFKSAYQHTLSDFPEQMKATKYSNIVSEGYKHYESEKTFIFLEKEIEDYLTDYLKRAKLIPFGPEALISYFLAKKNNALVIRMIMVNKLNTIDPEEIRLRLRKLYI